MPVSFSIKNVPDDVAEKLRRRAAQRHRSLQGELLATLEESVAEEHNGSLKPTEKEQSGCWPTDKRRKKKTYD
ncbi:MAG: Arc family DNA-binding protein [Syntrophorhabdales bacterium]|jgi:plasmid stability protein